MDQVPHELVEATVQAFGTDVRVTASTGGVDGNGAELLAELLVPWADAGATRVTPAGRSDGSGPTVALGALDRDTLERTGSQLSSRVTTAALRRHSGIHLMFHAGGVARPDGEVIAIVGPSGRGKTTTVRHLARHYGYVSDETITIAANGGVFPYRKPLSVITAGHVDKVQVPPSQLGLMPLPDGPLRIAGLALLERAPEGVEASRVEPLPLAEGLAELVQQTSYLLELEDPLCRIADIAARTGGLRRLVVGAPERVADVAERLFLPTAAEGGPSSDTRWERVVPTPGSGSDVLFMPADVVDAVECADGTVVFTADRRVHVLGGVGPVVWRGLCAGDDRAALDARVEAEFGAPPEGLLGDAVDAVCAGLADAGVLARR